MALNIKSSGDLIACSRLRQTDATTAGTFNDVGGLGLEEGALILFDENSGVGIVDNRESDAAEKTGFVEATDVDILDQSAEGTLTQAKATPDGIAFMAAYFCHSSVKATPEAGPPVHTHTARLLTYPTEPNYFTVVHRKGGGLSEAAAEYKRHVGLGVNTFRLLAAKEEFLTAEIGVLGLGTADDGVETENFVDHDFTMNPTGPVVITYDPHSDDVAAITAVADRDDDGIFETVLTGISYNQAMKQVSWTDPGFTGLHDVKIIYAVDQDETAFFVGDWAQDVEALVTPSEFKLKAANIQIILGGEYSSDSPPTFLGGQVAGCEVEQLEYNGDWQGNPGRCWRTGAVESSTAQSVDLGDVLQTLTVDRRVQDYLFKYAFDDNLPIGMYFDAIGPEIPGTASNNKFQVKVFWPKLKFLTKPLEIRDGRWVEAGNLVVLKPGPNDTVPTGPTMIVEVQNQVDDYLTT